MAEHSLPALPTHSRWNRALRPRLNIAPGDTVHMEYVDIVTFGRDYGSVTLEFERAVNGRIVHGRQSQVWVRLPEGWRIVSAHVSVLPG